MLFPQESPPLHSKHFSFRLNFHILIKFSSTMFNFLTGLTFFKINVVRFHLTFYKHKSQSRERSLAFMWKSERIIYCLCRLLLLQSQRLRSRRLFGQRLLRLRSLQRRLVLLELLLPLARKLSLLTVAVRLLIFL